MHWKRLDCFSLRGLRLIYLKKKWEIKNHVFLEPHSVLWKISMDNYFKGSFDFYQKEGVNSAQIYPEVIYLPQESLFFFFLSDHELCCWWFLHCWESPWQRTIEASVLQSRKDAEITSSACICACFLLSCLGCLSWDLGLYPKHTTGNWTPWSVYKIHGSRLIMCYLTTGMRSEMVPTNHLNEPFLKWFRELLSLIMHVLLIRLGYYK